MFVGSKKDNLHMPILNKKIKRDNIIEVLIKENEKSVSVSVSDKDDEISKNKLCLYNENKNKKNNPEDESEEEDQRENYQIEFRIDLVKLKKKFQSKKHTENRYTLNSRKRRKVTKDKIKFVESLEEIILFKEIPTTKFISIYHIELTYHTSVRHCICGDCGTYYKNFESLKIHCRNKHKAMITKGSLVNIKNFEKRYTVKVEYKQLVVTKIEKNKSLLNKTILRKIKKTYDESFIFNSMLMDISEKLKDLTKKMNSMEGNLVLTDEMNKHLILKLSGCKEIERDINDKSKYVQTNRVNYDGMNTNSKLYARITENIIKGVCE